MAMVLFSVVLLCWAFASPVGSSPDDDFHIANIYCLSDETSCRSNDAVWPEGQPGWPKDPLDRRQEPWSSLQEVYPDLWSFPSPRRLPCYVLNGTSDYFPDPAEPADCLSAEDQQSNSPQSVDNVYYYPNVNYRFLSLFTQDTIRESVAVWRVVVALVSVLMAGLSIGLSHRRWRRPLLLTWVICSVPLGAFLLASHNPSAWAIVGTMAMVGPGVALLQQPGRDGLAAARLAMVCLSVLLVLGGRSEGILFVGVGAAVILILGLRGGKAIRVMAWMSGAMMLLVTLVAAMGGLSILMARLGGNYLLTGQGGARGWGVLMEAPLAFATYTTRLGWLDIPMPQAVMIPAGAAFIGAVVLGLAVVDTRKAVTLVITFLVPLLATTGIRVISGAGLQHRYTLPLIYLFMLVALAPVGVRTLPRWSRAQWTALVVCLTVANSLALLYVELRYVIGINESASPAAILAVDTPDWWWQAWLSPGANWVIGSIAFPVALLTALTLVSQWEGMDTVAESAPDAPVAVVATPSGSQPDVPNSETSGSHGKGDHVTS